MEREQEIALKIAKFYESYDPYEQGAAFDGIEEAANAFYKQLRTKSCALDLLEEILNIVIIEVANGRID